MRVFACGVVVVVVVIAVRLYFASVHIFTNSRDMVTGEIIIAYSQKFEVLCLCHKTDGCSKLASFCFPESSPVC